MTAAYRELALGRLFHRSKVLGYVDEQMLSVYRDRGVVVKNEELNPNKTAEDRSIYQLVEPGWLVVNRMKAWQGSVGIAGLRGIVSGHYICFRPTHRENDRYLHYLLRSPAFAARFAAISRGVRPGQIEIDNDELASTWVSLPPLESQRRIADFLDVQVARIDNIVAARRAQIALVTAARQSEITRCLLAGGDLAGTAASAWYRRLPSSWPLRPLRAAWQVIDCKHRTPAYVEAGYPVVSPGDISPGPLDLKRCHRFIEEADYADLADALRRCRVGDIVYSRNASAGSAALVTTDEPFTMGQDVCRVTSSRPSQRYLYYVLNFAVAPQLEAARVGSTFTRINIDEIKALRVPVPPDNAQERISCDVDALAAEFAAVLAAQARQISLMDEFKRSLITAAVTGEFDVSTADGSRVSV